MAGSGWDPSILRCMVIWLVGDGMIERVVGRRLCRKVIGLMAVGEVHLSRIRRTAVRIAATGAWPKLSSVIRVIVVGHS